MLIIAALLFLHEIIIVALCCYNSDKNTRVTKKVIDESLEDVYLDYPWLRGDIDTLIQYSDSGYVVFIDIENELDWETKDKYDEIIITKNVNEILSEIDIIQKQAGFTYLMMRDRKSIVWRLGRALVLALDNNIELAKKMIVDANVFFINRKMETTRKWQLFIAIMVFVLLVLVSLLIEVNCGYEIKYWAHCMLYSSLGVLLSIQYKNGSLRYDCGAGIKLSILQIISKYIIGFIGMMFVLGLYEMGIIFHNIISHTAEIHLLILGIISGFSERLAPSMIEEISVGKDGKI